MSRKSDKIAGLAPRWASFVGFSVLGDNPGRESLIRLSPGIVKMRCRVCEDSQLGLYRTLTEAFRSIGGDALGLELFLFPVPPSSFHVTFWDGVNQGNISALLEPARHDFQRFCDQLPNSLLDSDVWPPLLRSRKLAEPFPGCWPICLKFSELRIWNDEALVAVLEPADEASRTKLERISDLRRDLDRDFAPLGRPPSMPLVPHVTLGYLASRGGALEAKRRLGQWNARFCELANRDVVEFRSASAYCFTSMSEFIKPSTTPPALLIPVAAIARGLGSQTKGYTKAVATTLWPGERLLSDVRWTQESVWLAEDLEVAFFDQRAKQDCHLHTRAAEIYTVLSGTMVIEVEGQIHELQAGDTIVVGAGAVHEVRPQDTEFLTVVVATNSAGALDRRVLPPLPNVTMVAFFGTSKPDPLVRLVESAQAEVRDVLRQHRLEEQVVKWYPMEKVHATLLGMEAFRIGGQLCSANFRKNNGQFRTMNIGGLLQFTSAWARAGRSMFRVRFGGFNEAYCTCSADQQHHWSCPTGGGFHTTYTRSHYQGSFYLPGGPVMLTGWPVDASGQEFMRGLYVFRSAAEAFGFLDKYHSIVKPHWKDDDCYLTLGAVGRLPEAVREEIQGRIRAYMRERGPWYVDIGLEDLSIVEYKDTKLHEVTAVVPLSEAIADPAKVEALYLDVR